MNAIWKYHYIETKWVQQSRIEATDMKLKYESKLIVKIDVNKLKKWVYKHQYI